jgi:hypothetical protein
MKKFIWIFLCSILLISCVETHTDAIEKVSKGGEEYLNINGRYYYKIKVLEHDVYQYTFYTHGDVGSDIIHFSDKCELCKTFKNTRDYTKNTDLIN